MDDLIKRQDAINALIEDKEMINDVLDSLTLDYNMRTNQEQRRGQINEDIDTIKALPSALIRINLNESIKVKLTDLGKEIYYHQYDEINRIAGKEICKPKFPKEDENGYTEFQLWRFIELYGTHISMTLPNVIEPLEIVYKR